MGSFSLEGFKLLFFLFSFIISPFYSILISIFQIQSEFNFTFQANMPNIKLQHEYIKVLLYLY
jgi:hypothetical protein